MRQHADEDIARRLFVAMYEEALRCRADGVISDLADADLASVEALGFPHEKGGIAQWGSHGGCTGVAQGGMSTPISVKSKIGSGRIVPSLT